MAFKNILVPVDFTDDARRVLAKAQELAAETGAHLALLHVGVSTDAVLSGAAGSVYHNLAERIESEQRETLSRMATELVPAEQPYSQHLRHGEPASEIVACAEEGGHDLIVMGTHGRRGLARMLLGSVAEQVVRSSPIPVLLIR
ncbi:MAG: universal stress protein A [Myxococcota bacterium]|jgi:universal stress protein A